MSLGEVQDMDKLNEKDKTLIDKILLKSMSWLMGLNIKSSIYTINKYGNQLKNEEKLSAIISQMKLDNRMNIKIVVLDNKGLIQFKTYLQNE